jgi:predicted DNA binding CopG/RHH family protein
MKKRIKYTDESIENVKIIKELLPSPEELIFKDKTVKVTIALSKTSVDYFKQVAKSYNTQYQKMIRRLLDEYVSKQKIAS